MGDMADAFVRRESKFDREARVGKRIDIKLGWALNRVRGKQVYQHQEHDDILIVDEDTHKSLYLIDTEFDDGELTINLEVIGTDETAYFFAINDCVKFVETNKL